MVTPVSETAQNRPANIPICFHQVADQDLDALGGTYTRVAQKSPSSGVAVLDAAELEAIKKSAFDEGVAVGVARGEAQLKAFKAASMQNLAREKGRNRIARSRLQGEVKAAKKSAATTIAAAEAKRRREEKLAAPAAWSEDKKRRHEKQHEAEKASSKGGHQQKRARQRAAEARKGERR